MWPRSMMAWPWEGRFDTPRLPVGRRWCSAYLERIRTGGCLRPLPFWAHRRRWRCTATDTDRGYRGGLLIRRLVGMQRLTAELRDRGVRVRCASTMTAFLSKRLSNGALHQFKAGTHDAVQPSTSWGKLGVRDQRLQLIQHPLPRNARGRPGGCASACGTLSVIPESLGGNGRPDFPRVPTHSA